MQLLTHIAPLGTSINVFEYKVIIYAQFEKKKTFNRNQIINNLIKFVTQILYLKLKSLMSSNNLSTFKPSNMNENFWNLCEFY